MLSTALLKSNGDAVQGRHAARRVIELLCKDDGTGQLYYEADTQHMHQ
jgi:hypothetical protein